MHVYEPVFLMLGGNVGDRMDYLLRCEELLRKHVGIISGMSSIYESEPWGFNDPVWFFNRAVMIETPLSPHNLLQCTRQIEHLLGRIRRRGGYHPRTMDIDILLYGARVINTPQLTVPHLRMAERNFVMYPMAELAPQLIHPVLRKSMICLRDQCKDQSKVYIFV